MPLVLRPNDAECTAVLLLPLQERSSEITSWMWSSLASPIWDDIRVRLDSSPVRIYAQAAVPPHTSRAAVRTLARYGFHVSRSTKAAIGSRVAHAVGTVTDAPLVAIITPPYALTPPGLLESSLDNHLALRRTESRLPSLPSDFAPLIVSVHGKPREVSFCRPLQSAPVHLDRFNVTDLSSGRLLFAAWREARSREVANSEPDSRLARSQAALDRLRRETLATSIDRLDSLPKSSRRILVLATASLWAGAQSSLCESVRTLSAGRTTTVAIVSHRGRLSRALEKAGVICVPTYRDVASLASSWVSEMDQLVSVLAPEAIHLNGFEGMAPLVVARKHGIPFYQHVKSCVIGDQRQSLDECSKAISVSQRVSNVLLSVGVPGDRIVLAPDLPPAIRPEYLAETRVTGPFTLGCGGRICPQKRQHVVLEAFAEFMNDTSEQGRLIIWGPIDRPHQYYDSLIESVARLGLADNVFVLGEVRYPRRVVAQCDVLVSWGEQEALGMAAIEALMLGVPVICAPDGGTGELLRGAEREWIAKSPRAPALAELMSRHAADRACQRALAIGVASRLGAPRHSSIHRNMWTSVPDGQGTGESRP